MNKYITSNLPNDAVITQNDDRITAITYLENGKTYTTSIDKEHRKMYLEHNGTKYEMIVDALESNEYTQESEFLGHLVNIETGEIIDFDDLDKSNYSICCIRCPFSNSCLNESLRTVTIRSNNDICCKFGFCSCFRSNAND